MVRQFIDHRREHTLLYGIILSWLLMDYHYTCKRVHFCTLIREASFFPVDDDYYRNPATGQSAETKTEQWSALNETSHTASPFPKVHRSLWKMGQKDSKSQGSWMTTRKQCFLGAVGHFHTWIHSSQDSMHKPFRDSSQTNPSIEGGVDTKSNH